MFVPANLAESHLRAKVPKQSIDQLQVRFLGLLLLKQKLLHAVANPIKDDLIKKFPEIFYGKVRVMPSETFKIELTEDARTYCVTNSRPVLIITPVSKPTNWCLHSVVAPKKNGKIRLCIDFRPLNKFVKHEHYQMTFPATAVADSFCIKSVVLSEIVATGVNLKLEEVKSASTEDQEYQEFYQVIQNGFPEEKGNLPEGLRKYWAVKHHLFIVADTILLGCHTLIPKSFRKKCHSFFMKDIKASTVHRIGQDRFFIGQELIEILNTLFMARN